MSNERPPDVLSALPRTRPHRRSDRRVQRAEDSATSAETGTTPDAPVEGRRGGEAEAQPASRQKPKSNRAPATKASSSTANKATPARSAKRRAQNPAATRAPGNKPAGAGRPPAATKPPVTATASPRPAAQTPRAVADERARAPYKGERLRQPPQPSGTPRRAGPRKPVPASGAEILGTAVQAAAELAEIGLSVSARALRNAVSRLPRP